MPSPFQPDYRNMLAVMENRRPARLPVYEHLINPPVIEAVLGVKFAELFAGGPRELDEYFRHYCRFWQAMTYDTISFEVCITEILPDGGALLGERPGPVQTRADFERYPWDELPERFWRVAAPRFDALLANNAAGDESPGRGGQWRVRDQRRPGRLPVPGVYAG